jgi:predicted O-methyltransferase YrrM
MGIVGLEFWKDMVRQARSVDLSHLSPPLQCNSWTLTHDLLRLLTRIVECLSPRHIVEFGSGESTRVLAWACETADVQCAITSLEHDPDYVETTRERLRLQRTSVSVRVLLAPVVARKWTETMVSQYRFDRAEMASSHPADLVIIDGPPEALGGREGTFYQAIELSRPGTLILLDDASRPGEKHALSRWGDTFADAISIELVPGFAKGLAAITVHEPVRQQDFARFRVRVATQEIRASIGETPSFLLVDQNQTGIRTIGGSCAVPFMERGGRYWGPPGNDEEAIAELERQRDAGIGFIVFAWPAFWWLDHYRHFATRLRTSYRRILASDRVVVYDLRA